MAYSTGVPGLAAAAALVALAGVLPIDVHAEADRAFPRSDRLLLPLGAVGPSNPVLLGVRKVEQEIEQKGSLEPAAAPLVNWLARRRPDAIVLPRAATEAIAPAAASAPQAREAAPSEGWPRVLPKRNDHIVLAAFDAAEPAAAATVDKHGLAFSSTPPVPGLVSSLQKPLVSPLGIKPLRAAERAPLVNLRRSAKGGALNLPLLQRRHRVSVRTAFARSQRGDPVRTADAVAVAYSGTDPLGDMKSAFASRPERSAPPFIMPFANGRVTSLFNQGRWHPAIDLAGRHGSPVYATSSGQQVTFAGWRGGYGMAVIARDREGREHLYGHLSAITTRVGVVLAQGQRLGSLGSTGYSTGPHVHYEVKDRRGVHINPVVLLFPGRRVGNGLAWSDPAPVGGGRNRATAEVGRGTRTR